MFFLLSATCRSCDQHFNSCEQLKVHACKSSESENQSKKTGKAVGEAAERGPVDEVVEGERTGEVPRPESLKAHNAIQHLLGNDNLLVKGVASDKEMGGEDRSPCHQKREYNVLYETEDSLKNADSGR